jgi:hypothetical protein
MGNESSSVKVEILEHARSMLRSGVKPKVVYDMLIANGATPEVASSILEDNNRDRYIDGDGHETVLSNDRKAAMNTLMMGVGFFTLGAIITWTSFNAASPGGSFLVSTGLLAIGILQFFRGLWQLIFG